MRRGSGRQQVSRVQARQDFVPGEEFGHVGGSLPPGVAGRVATIAQNNRRQGVLLDEGAQNLTLFRGHAMEIDDDLFGVQAAGDIGLIWVRQWSRKLD